MVGYEGLHTPALVRSDLLEEDINIEDEQMDLASSDEDGDWLIQRHYYSGKWCMNIINVWNDTWLGLFESTLSLQITFVNERNLPLVTYFTTAITPTLIFQTPR